MPTPERFIIEKNKNSDRAAWPFVIRDQGLGRAGTVTAKVTDEFTAGIVVRALNREWF